MASHVLLITVICLPFILSLDCPHNGGLLPVILVPGISGNRLEAKLDKPKVVHTYCTRRTLGYFTLWLNIKEILPLVIDCWVDNMKLNYDSFYNKSFNQPGVQIRVPGFGNPDMVEYLDSKTKHFVGGYMNRLVNSLVSLGYIRQKNLFAAPYDFRKGPSESENFFEDLKSLIENTYEYNSNSSVILVGHSLGGHLVLNLLQSVTQEWKDKYVRAFISLAAPFAGAVKALKVFAAGDDLGVFFLQPLLLKEVLSSMPGVAYLLPSKGVWGDEILVSTPTKDYSLDNLEEFFNDIGKPTGWQMYVNEQKFASQLSPPGVETYCFHGAGMSTLKKLIYRSNDFPEDPLMEYENGDGTVNLRSLEYCKTWITQQKERVKTRSFDGIDHMAIVEDEEAIEYISKTVKELSQC